MDTKHIKKMILRFILIGLLSLGLGVAKSHAQMHFPEGNTLNLHTNSSVLYFETRILFTTGIYKSTDYRWEKVSDSLDSRWVVSSCFNGDCKNDLLQSGQFIKDFGLNDTTCFMAFHVDCNELSGASLIKYNIFNTKSMSDYATLTFNINYTSTSSIKSIDANKSFNVYPNPAKDYLNISNNNAEPFDLELYNLQGQLLHYIHADSNKINIPLSKDKYNKGVYFVKITNKESSQFHKFAIE